MSMSPCSQPEFVHCHIYIGSPTQESSETKILKIKDETLENAKDHSTAVTQEIKIEEKKILTLKKRICCLSITLLSLVASIVVIYNYAISTPK